MKGLGVACNATEAEQWYSLAAAGGNRQAKARLARLAPMPKQGGE